MKTVALLTLLVAAAALMGCTTDPCKEECCGQFNANCCGWEFYKPCHRTSRDACDDELISCPTRVVLNGCTPIEQAAPAEVEAAPEAAVEAAPAEYGAPPAGR